MAEKVFTCIVCPRSCVITVKEGAEGALEISGQTCKRGEDFARAEYTNPVRMLTTTVKIDGGRIHRLPVISRSEIPKAKLPECLAYLYGIQASAPVKSGDVICADVCGTGVDIVAARDVASA